MIVDFPHVEYGIEGVVGKKLDRKFYYNNYDMKNKIPYWVAYCADSDSLIDIVKREDQWVSDPDLPHMDVYRDSCYDKGHMAPAADFKRSKEAMESTFYLSNAAPQIDSLNRIIWKKVEEKIRNAVRKYGKGWIVTGPLFIDDKYKTVKYVEKLKNIVSIPTHFFKLLLLKNKKNDSMKMWAILLANKRIQRYIDLSENIISIDSLEKISGYDFFPLLPNCLEDSLESDCSKGCP